MARKRKQKEVDLDVSYVHVEAETQVEVVREDDGELYGRRECTAAYTSIHGIKDVGKDGYYDLVVGFKLEDNVDYYLVHVNYNTGDSFGHDDGKVCYVEMFKSKELAKQLVDAISENAQTPSYLPPGKKRYKEQPMTITYERDDGQKVDCYTGTWRGYFERVNYVEMEAVRTEQHYRRTP
ncbi:MAG: hypothetical protein E4H14_14830 [Candidatus Thorarchaeota archaeon]|nr:MAG: hypothetical protein E4H14_14830 [Candidatus Thorarchaeota archaeon]